MSPERIKQDVERARWLALGYAWGRQDAGHSLDDTDCQLFSHWYAAFKATYLHEQSWHWPPLRAMWRAYCEGAGFEP